MTPTLPRWCVLIPCLNEEVAIRGVVESVLALGAPVIVVDDGSDDRTPEILAALPVTVLRHDRRLGKGHALRDGFREALRSRGTIELDEDVYLDAAALSGVSKYVARVKCAMLPWVALEDALAKSSV